MNEKICPHCGAKEAVGILYGLPNTEGMAAAGRGEVVLGGCEVAPDHPTRACRECGSMWGESEDLSSTAISRVFAEYFSNWSIALPPGSEAAESLGTIHKAGWTINYIFGRDGEKYVEFYATHRMTNDRRHRIYESGRTEGLDAIWEMYAYDPKIPGSEEEAKKRYLEHNQRVADELRRLRLFPEGDINAFLRTNDVPPPK